MAVFKPTKITTKAEKTVISFRMENDKLEQVDRLAHQSDISRNELILQCIDFALQHLPPESRKAMKK